MPIDPRTPVLVGVGAVQQQNPDPTERRAALELMLDALRLAAQDAGAPTLLSRADAILVPRGFWPTPDPGRWLAESLAAANRPRTTVAELGVLQTSLFAEAAAAIAGGADVVLVAGGEAKDRARLASRAGLVLPEIEQPADTAPDRALRPAGEILTQLEVKSGLAMPVTQYSMMENALRHARGQNIATHLEEVARMWSDMSDVAAGNLAAWSRERIPVETLCAHEGPNRGLAFPYGRLHNSQWNVDQAAGLVFCSFDAAQRAGIPNDRLVFPLAVAESNSMLPLSRRRTLHRSEGFRQAGEAVSRRLGQSLADIEHRELYSCFPVAVRIQALEFGLPLDARHTLTGGMAFAGGPLNNFVLQAAVRLVETLRAHPGEKGLLTAVSGMLTKQGVSTWSTEPAAAGFRYDDVSTSVASAQQTVAVVEPAEGAARIAGYTSLFNADGPTALVALCDFDEGRRAIARCDDPELAARGCREELCGLNVKIDTATGRIDLS